ncbi:hypothetical protein BDR05DRAFT_947646 [Suillus weaverae]|nr:hypothetical protein BDR05DRAFT_947646 [Suillus weaverae]
MLQLRNSEQHAVPRSSLGAMDDNDPTYQRVLDVVFLLHHSSAMSFEPGSCLKDIQLLEWEVNGLLLEAPEGPKMIRTRVQIPRVQSKLPKRQGALDSGIWAMYGKQM